MQSIDHSEMMRRKGKIVLDDGTNLHALTDDGKRWAYDRPNRLWRRIVDTVQLEFFCENPISELEKHFRLLDKMRKEERRSFFLKDSRG